MRDAAIAGFFMLAFIREAMSTKFVAGFLTGAYVATQYDFKPYFDIVEVKVRKQIKDFKSPLTKESPKQEKRDLNQTIREFFK
jgi:hypothetical protein